MNSEPSRNQERSTWRAKALSFSLAATIAAVLIGALLGLVGSWLSLQFRIAAASLLSVIAIGVAIGDATSMRLSVLQCDRETSQTWMNLGPLRWAARNGAALGLGFTSRIGFWLWYAVPTGALLFADPRVGGVIYGLYGATRAWSVWLLLLGKLNRISDGNPSVWLLMRYPQARIWTARLLAVLGTTVAIVVGW